MLLDVLLIVIGLLFFSIGFRRGVVREVFVTAGLLSGAMLSLSWSRPWGEDAAELFRLSSDSSRVVVSLGFILGLMLILGYGGPSAIDLDGGFVTRGAAGALLGLYNGVLLVGYALRDVERYLADDATMRMLRQSSVAWFLLRQSGWVMFSAVLLFSSLILWSMYKTRSELRVSAAAGSGRSTSTIESTHSRTRKTPRLRWGQDGDKVEPLKPGATGLSVSLGSANGNFGASVPLAPVDGSLWADRALSTQTSGPDWLEIVAARELERSPESSRLREASSQPTLTVCSGCGERLGNEEIYCPLCGRAGSTR